MALESFYGGKQGISPVIKKHYSSINQMRTDFETNKTQDVWFGELAIINTESKSSPDNGKLFRRVLKVTSGQENFNAGTQAEYIGQIVGPPGETPFIAFDSIGEIKKKIIDENSINVAFITEDGIETEKTNANNLAYISSGAIESVSGEDNSEIKYTWANVRLSNDDYAYIYLGFQIPYPHFEPWKTISTSYTASPSIELLKNKIEIDKNGQEIETINPFYWRIKAQIPRGLPGVRPEVKLGKKEEFTELNSETNKIQYLESGPQFYNETAILKYDEVKDNYSFDIDAEIKDPNDLPNEFWYIKFTCPKRNGNFDILYQYIDEGPNHIESIYGTQKYMYILYSSKEYRFNPSVENPEDFPDEYTDSAGRKWIKDPNQDWEEKNLYWEQLSGFSINRFGIKTKITTDKLSVKSTDNAEAVLEALNKEPQQNPEHKNKYYQGKDGNGKNVDSQWIQWDQENVNNEIVATNYYYYDSVAQEWRLVLGLDSETIDINIYSGLDPIDNVVAKGFVKENITFENFDWSDIYNE